VAGVDRLGCSRHAIGAIAGALAKAQIETCQPENHRPRHSVAVPLERVTAASGKSSSSGLDLVRRLSATRQLQHVSDAATPPDAKAVAAVKIAANFEKPALPSLQSRQHRRCDNVSVLINFSL
jgi:hypothetical protein